MSYLLDMLYTVVVTSFFCWVTWKLTRQHYQAKRLSDVQKLRQRLFDGAKWNASEFPQYAAALEDLNKAIGEWEKSIGRGDKEDWPWQVKQGDQLRRDLRNRFKPAPDSFTLT